MKPISKLLAESKTGCVTWEGEPLYGLYEFPAPKNFIVELLRSKPTPIQGLNLKVYGGVMSINDVESSDMLIWADTAPNNVAVTFKPRKGGKATLKIWNVWRVGMGELAVTHAWHGNSGMRIEVTAKGKELLLRCSDGVGPVNFSDLEARVTIL